jgi:hypothetical protein
MTTKRELYICHQYLNFPVKNGAAMRKVRIRVGDQVVRLFDIEWAEGDVDFWVFTDISEFKDEQLIVENDGWHGPFEKEGEVALMAGLHKIKLLYFQSGGRKSLEVFMKNPDIKKAAIDPNSLFN